MRLSVDDGEVFSDSSPSEFKCNINECENGIDIPLAKYTDICALFLCSTNRMSFLINSGSHFFQFIAKWSIIIMLFIFITALRS